MHSKYFLAFFNGDFYDSNAKNIDFRLVNSKDFNEMLLIIYPCRKLINCKWELYIIKFYYLDANFQNMLHVSDALDIPALRIMCERFIIKNKTKIDIFLKFKLADTYKLLTLKVFFFNLNFLFLF